MTSEERKILLTKLNIDKEKALESANPNVSAIQAIFGELMRLDEEERPHFRSFVVSLQNDLFDRGAFVSGLDLELFKSAPILESLTAASDKEAVISIPPKEIIEKQVENSTNGIEEEKIEPDWFDTLKKMHTGLDGDLKTLKQYFFLRLIYDSSSPYIPLVLYESDRYFQPVSRRLNDVFSYNCETQSIDSIQEEISRREFPKTNYIAILLLSTKINNEVGLNKMIEKIENIINSFESFENIAIKKTNKALVRKDLIRSDQIDPFIDEIKYITSILLTNAEISNDEETIIKKLFRHMGSPILEYKVIKKGQSGSRVFEIRPRISTQSKRYIVKFEAVNEKRKIWDEYNRFGQHVEICPIEGGYHSKHEKNATVECIQYVYASSNTITKSYSFADIISEKKGIDFKASDTLDDFFTESLLFDYWNKNTVSKGRYKIGALYGQYVKIEEFRQNIMQIKGYDDTEIDNYELYKNFLNIFDFEFNTNQKTCHGDLHSENFFRDEKGCYLIDFGFTGERHALIDHAMLECSIKYKHIPFYIELEVLKEIERQLVTEGALTGTFDISTERKDIKKYYDLIKIIRKDSRRYYADKNSNLEYLISLFMITCRLVQYGDLNQLYAITSAEIISEKIIELINLSSLN